jgi:hypothetical protein
MMPPTRLAAVATLFVLAACPDQGPRGALSVAIFANKAELAPGEYVTLRIVAHNNSAELQVLRPSCSDYFLVFDSEHRPVPPEYGGCYPIAYQNYQLAPGDSAIFGTIWNGHRMSNGNGVLVPAGIYSIVGRVFTPTTEVSGDKGIFLYVR